MNATQADSGGDIPRTAAVPRTGRYRWMIIAILFFATTVNYIDRTMLGLLKPGLQGELGWSENDYGNIVMAFQAAYAFIDYMIGKEFYAGWVKAGGAPVSANAKAIEELPDSSLTRQILATPDALKRLNFKGPLSDEQRQEYLDLWQETKAYFAE